MITVDELKRMCTLQDDSKAYYRPFICNGELTQVDTFLIGINPATPILQSELDIDEYVKLLLNYDEFIKYYKRQRVSKGKTELSRTRMAKY